jgi:putative lipoic acid-binding regulatory protein
VINLVQTHSAIERTLVVIEPSSQGSRDGVTIKVSSAARSQMSDLKQRIETDALETRRSEKAARA